MPSRTLLLTCALAGIFVAVCILPPESSASPSSQDTLHEPCDFFETVNVTGDTSFSNGSYLHGDVLIPAHLVGVYDHIYQDLDNRVEVTPHMRGCICKVKACINLCCPWGSSYNYSLNVCRKTAEHLLWPTPELNITLANNSLKTVDIFKDFVVQNFRPCHSMYSLQPDEFDYDEWQIFQDGTMLRVQDNAYLNKNDFCLVPTLANGSHNVLVINPANCHENTEFSTVKSINAYAMLFSIPFMVFTIVVYLTLSELRNQHGKSLVCYLLGLIVGYSLLSCNVLIDHMDITHLSCIIIGYTTYYSFIAAFFWLSVISFDLWYNFRGIHRVNSFLENKRFVIYSVYAWGLAAIFLVFTWFMQEMTTIPDHYKPGIGGGEFCWLDMRSWSAMIYFFGPILLIIVANIMMFVFTAMKIHKVQREISQILAREDSTKNLRTQEDNFGLFLRLFIVMGVTWSLEIVSYFVGTDSKWAKFFYITDFCNAIQGFLIFMLFVMKKKIKTLVTNRIWKTKSSGSNHTNSTNSTTSGEINSYPMKSKAQSDDSLKKTEQIRNIKDLN